MSKVKIIGLIMVIASAGLYIAYPTPTIAETLTLGLMWMLALFGGALALYGSLMEKKEKKK
jgi:DMSO reductase anchor subunit